MPENTRQSSPDTSRAKPAFARLSALQKAIGPDDTRQGVAASPATVKKQSQIDELRSDFLAIAETARRIQGLSPSVHGHSTVSDTPSPQPPHQACVLPGAGLVALWRTLEQWKQAKGLDTCARQLVKQMATIKSVLIVVPVRRAAVTSELRLRVVTPPKPATAPLLVQLGLHPPKATSPSAM